jgi:ABC-type Co2+ transport system permease subunit
MSQRAAAVVILAVTSFLTLLALGGHSPMTGHQVVTISGNHGVNTGDVIPLAAWAVVAACCLVIWRRAD